MGCHSLSLASVKLSLVLPFWYRPTRVVPEKGPLNVCVCVCVLVCVHAWVRAWYACVLHKLELYWNGWTDQAVFGTEAFFAAFLWNLRILPSKAFSQIPNFKKFYTTVASAMDDHLKIMFSVHLCISHTMSRTSVYGSWNLLTNYNSLHPSEFPGCILR